MSLRYNDMKHNYEISYANVKLKPLQEDDIENLRVWRNNPDNTTYLQQVPYITKEMQQNWYEKYMRNQNEMTFVIVETNVLQRVVGSLSLYNFSENSAEFGKILIGDPEAHGRHLGTNSLKAALLVAFRDLGLDEVYLNVHADNVKAVCSYKNAGMKIVNKIIHESFDEYVMSIKRKDFGVEGDLYA